MDGMNYAVLWSPSQNAISVETVAEMLETNRQIFADQNKGDFIVMGFAETLEQARKDARALQAVRDVRLEGLAPPEG